MANVKKDYKQTITIQVERVVRAENFETADQIGLVMPHAEVLHLLADRSYDVTYSTELPENEDC